MPAYLESFRAWKSAYLQGASWEDRRGLEARIAAILGVFLLARVDGKSPVEYLTEAADKAFVRGAALQMIVEPPYNLDVLAETYFATAGQR